MATDSAHEPQEFMVCKLPFDLLVNIISRLPLHDIVQCKLVCKDLCNSLRTFISDPSFINLHHSQVTKDNNPDFIVFSSNSSHDYYKLYLANVCTSSTNGSMTVCLDSLNFKCFDDGFKGYIWMVGSSNGFICLVSHNDNGSVLYLCNPITRETLELPKASNYYRPSGFAFDSSNNTFKVINTCYNWISRATEVEVFTLATGTWRKVEDIADCELSGLKPVLVNGVLYWVTMTQSTEIVAMNICDETFKKLRGPPKENWKIVHACMVSGCLSVIANGHDDWEIWCLKNDTWEMKQHITKHQPHGYDLCIFAGMSNGSVLFRSEKNYSLHHSGNGKIQQIKTYGFGYRSISILNALPHVGSLVTLKTLNH